jgi:hypothetical protein
MAGGSRIGAAIWCLSGCPSVATGLYEAEETARWTSKAITYLLRHWKALTTFLREAGAPLDNNIVTAARGSAKIMPTARLCRVGVAEQCLARRISGFRGVVCRHNHRLSRKASKGSGGRNRSGVSPDGVACASARSFSCMSACR